MVAAQVYSGLVQADADTATLEHFGHRGSDILYERDHAQMLAELVLRHAKPRAEIITTDPGRGVSAAFSRAMITQGFRVEETRCKFNEADISPFRGRLISYLRN